MTGSSEAKDTVPRGSRRLLSRGLATVIVATLALLVGEPRCSRRRASTAARC